MLVIEHRSTLPREIAKTLETFKSLGHGVLAVGGPAREGGLD